jgi:cell division septal protein FtsQ
VHQSRQLAPELSVQNFVGQDIRWRCRHRTYKAKIAAGFGCLVLVVVYLPAARLQKVSMSNTVLVMDDEEAAAAAAAEKE